MPTASGIAFCRSVRPRRTIWSSSVSVEDVAFGPCFVRVISAIGTFAVPQTLLARQQTTTSPAP
jgi:hypothetical protein